MLTSFEAKNVTLDNPIQFSNNAYFNFILKGLFRVGCQFTIADTCRTLKIPSSCHSILESLEGDYRFSTHPQFKDRILPRGEFQHDDELRTALAFGELKTWTDKPGKTYLHFTDNAAFNRAIQMLMTYSATSFRVADYPNTFEIGDVTLYQYLPTPPLSQANVAEEDKARNDERLLAQKFRR